MELSVPIKTDRTIQENQKKLQISRSLFGKFLLSGFLLFLYNCVRRKIDFKLTASKWAR